MDAGAQDEATAEREGSFRSTLMNIPHPPPPLRNKKKKTLQTAAAARHDELNVCAGGDEKKLAFLDEEASSFLDDIGTARVDDSG